MQIMPISNAVCSLGLLVIVIFNDSREFTTKELRGPAFICLCKNYIVCGAELKAQFENKI